MMSSLTIQHKVLTTDKTLATLTKKKRAQINKIRTVKEMTTDTIQIQRSKEIL